MGQDRDDAKPEGKVDGIDEALGRISEGFADLADAVVDKATETAKAFGSSVKGGASKASARYGEVVGKAKASTEAGVGRATARLDERMGDRPWQGMGLDERNTLVARRVLVEVVPRVAAGRVASVMDGLSIKGGLVGGGLALRMPLKVIAAPLLLALTAWETVKVVREIKDSIGDVGRQVDAEMEAKGSKEVTVPA